MVSDRMFIVDAQRAAELQALTSKAPVWFYKFNFRGEHSLSDLMTGTKTDYGKCPNKNLKICRKLFFTSTRIA